jgi:hypothetical protein
MGKGTLLRALSDFITNGQLDWAKMDDYFDVVRFQFHTIQERGKFAEKDLLRYQILTIITTMYVFFNFRHLLEVKAMQ